MVTFFYRRRLYEVQKYHKKNNLFGVLVLSVCLNGIIYAENTQEIEELTFKLVEFKEPKKDEMIPLDMKFTITSEDGKVNLDATSQATYWKVQLDDGSLDYASNHGNQFKEGKKYVLRFEPSAKIVANTGFKFKADIPKIKVNNVEFKVDQLVGNDSHWTLNPDQSVSFVGYSLVYEVKKRRNTTSNGFTRWCIYR